MTRWMTPMIACLVPLAVWTGLEQPFSTPKLVLIGCWIALACGWMLATRTTPKIELTGAQTFAYLAWLTLIALSALTGELVSPRAFLLLLLPALCFPLLLGMRAEPRRLCLAFGLSSVVVSATAVLQYVGMDPFRLLGWTTPPGGSDRLLVYGTLGNPNFVAAFLSACLPLLVALLFGDGTPDGRRLRWPWLLAILMNLAAIFATGSRAPALACLAAFPVILLLGTRNAKLRSQPGRKAADSETRIRPTTARHAEAVSRRADSRFRIRRFTARLARIGSFFVIVGTVALVLAFAIILLSAARPLATTLSGRAYIVRTVLRNVSEIPVFGFGPGAFSVKYFQWQTDHLREERQMAESPFRGPQDHAHNDYLELLTDTGPAGLACFIALLVLLAVPAVQRKPDRFGIAGLAGAVALLTISLVDFPLHRPAESFLLWSLLAIASTKRERGSHF